MYGFLTNRSFDLLFFFPRRMCVTRAGGEPYIKGEHGGKVGGLRR
jgi:hypothetical protein